METFVFYSVEGVAKKSLEFLRGPRIALLGGNTFTALVREWVPEISRRIQEGESFRFFPVDERAVPFEDAASNWGSVYEHLLLPCGLVEQKTHHVTTAQMFLELLQKEFGSEPIIFDTVFLGMGEDGHVASLFPGHAALQNLTSLVIDISDSPKPPAKRVTLGLRPIQESKSLVLVALGKGKAEAVRRIMDSDESLPATRVLQNHPNAVLLLDTEAASLL